LTLAAALEEGVILPTESFDCEKGAWTYQGKVMHDAHSYGSLTVSEMLAVSSNIGFSKIFDRLGGDRLARWLRAFRLGTAPPVEGANAGWMPERIADKSYEGAVVAIGEKVVASPLQVAAAYGALANGGVYVAPTLSRRTSTSPSERIMKPETARTVMGMLEDAVNSERATGKLARIAGPRVAGKTGTAGWDLPNGEEGIYASFVGIVPSSSPRFVILVGVEQPQKHGGGGEIAAPVFARVASRALSGKVD
jgi:cell division protein FtsI (penicillin-binding protein 3)